MKDYTPSGLIKTIQNAWVKYGKQNVRFDYDYNFGYEDSINVEIFLECTRDMTEEELVKKKQLEESTKQHQLEWERRQYEALKRKFEND